MWQQRTHTKAMLKQHNRSGQTAPIATTAAATAATAAVTAKAAIQKSNVHTIPNE